MSKNKSTAQNPKKPFLWVGLVAIVALIAVGAVLLGGQPKAAAVPLEISVAEAVQKRAEGAFILDVRQPEEWNEVHIPGATLIPLGELPSRLNEVPRDQEIVVVCRSGNRSQSGRDILLDAGFKNVTSMAGGVNSWKSQGYPTVTGP